MPLTDRELKSAIAKLRERQKRREADDAARAEIAAAYTRDYPAELDATLDLLAAAIGADERAPEPERPARAKRAKALPEPADWLTPTLAPEERARLLTLTVPEMVDAAKALTADQLAELRAAVGGDVVRVAALAKL